ncbi:hypothetical protein RY831_14505 [Noviherbaspirillum sp. CPCC 100848]|jgi:hypothetical protein|uniref:Uncharacterized protein n=1 Tax=Noviherbaspirillum album TaxID=3080276 RepID=A0ABU6JAN5_9BURK|nr:hypothetical protein [Noviherbaspirillum sp. CPCC 100848]MEC4720370.1 hypothetical protein [Noviherbaspirillum sp. CPCC 100848]
MKAKPSLLVAVRPKGLPRLCKALEAEFSLAFCHTLADAQAMLDKDIQGIVCGTNFDESRMFDLLRYAKSKEQARNLPSVCVKVFGSVLHDGTFAGVEKAAKLLGASAYIDFAQWRVEMGKLDAAMKLRSTLHALIANH